MRRPVLLVAAVVVALLVVVGVFLLFSGQMGESSVEVHGAFFRRGTMAAGVFFIAHNHGFSEACIVGAEVLEPQGLRAELHRTVVEEGVAKMQRVERICISPRGEVRALGVEGDGHHIMVFPEVPAEAKLLKIRLILGSGNFVDFEAKEQILETHGGEEDMGHHGG